MRMLACRSAKAGGLFLLTAALAGCGDSQEATSGAPSASAPSTAASAVANEAPRAASAAELEQSALKASRYRQGLCTSMQASLQRIEASAMPQSVKADLESIRFVLGNMLGAYPSGSVAPSSKLLPEALAKPEQIASLRDTTLKAVNQGVQAKTSAAFIQSHQSIRQACMACHSQITRGITIARGPATFSPANPR